MTRAGRQRLLRPPGHSVKACSGRDDRCRPRAWSGKAGTGFPKKIMRLNRTEGLIRFHLNGSGSRSCGRTKSCSA
jgi:hypothetical protein